MNTKPIQVVHDDVPITYNEGENRWTFTLRGRDRSAVSLAKAKEYIDKPLPPEKAKPFEKIPAWFFKYNGAPKKVVVTGVGENRGYEVWIDDSGKRSKENAMYGIYPSDQKNDALIAQILTKEREIGNAENEILSLKEKLSPLVLPKDE